jgi:CheY-like chemotaxis protein
MSHRPWCFPLVVEDDDNFALLLQHAFGKAGIPGGNVRRYSNGESALRDLLAAHSVQPSVLTLDMELPGMSGLSLLERIRSLGSFANLPAFFISGRTEPSLISSAYALRAKGYWAKPQNLRDLQVIVDGMLECIEHSEPTGLPLSIRDPRGI